MNKDDVDVGTGLVGAPACGDVMKLQVSLSSILAFTMCDEVTTITHFDK